ncbi:MAG: hypothetical protein M1828_004750 [Chrysothrix sp. TS-e1954]|nr:MAG: hypothetical protein M1828_004750 [Chrysothrix sp. TS-e1954]
MSKMSLFMSMLSFSSHRETREARRKTALLQDLRYLYSCFTKLPCLRLVNTSGAKLICNFEEFPLDTAVPLHAFKNLTVLEICDVDFRSVYGWDRLAEQLRSLTVKRVGLISVTDLIIGIVLDDADQRRRQSCKTPTSPMHGHSSWATAGFRESIGSSQEQGGGLIHAEQTMDPLAASAVDSSVHGEISGSPERPLARSVSSSGWYGGRVTHDSNTNENPDKRSRRGSEGSTLSRLSFSTPRRSTTNLLATAFQTTSKWNFLRHLSLSDNGMTGLEEEGLRPLADILQSLDISDNLFTRIPASLGELHALRQLNVCNCMIDSLDEMSLSTLSRVAVLNLRANRLGSLIGIENVGQLERLDLRDNQLHDPTEVRRLAGSQCFHDIFVNGNPFVTSQSDYRVTIFNSFRKYSPFPHDVTVDAAGPQQHELDQLIDRTAGQSFEMASGADSGQDHTAPDKAHAVAGQRVRDVNLDGRETAGQMFPQNIHEQRMPDSHVTASVSKMHAVNEYTASPLSNASLVQPVVVGTLEAGNTGTPLSA